MTPNGLDLSRKYGKHSYPNQDGTSDCKNGCGCWAGPSQSGGPLGLDPIYGECPNNPVGGERLDGDQDYQIVVKRRILDLESRAHTAETALDQVKPDKKELAQELENTQQQLSAAEQKIQKIVDHIDSLR